MDIPSAPELEQATGGRYAIEGVFATGGMGAVFSGRNRALGSRVAIKVLPSEVAFSTVRLARFKREASLAANLSHPNIVPVFEFDASQGLAYFVMPFVEGRSLDDHLRESGKLSYVTIRELVEQVGSALAFAHERDVVHRDIKPGNILREEGSGRWLITDFGVAHVTTTADETDITQTGAVIGTPAYMSPEQSWGGAIDRRTDLYAFAAVIYQAITGTSIADLRDDLAHKPEELERTVRRAVPSLKPALARALVWPLAVAKEDRPNSVEEWLGAVREAERTKHPRAWIAAAVVGSLAVAAWMFFQRPTGPAAPSTETVVAVLPIIIVGGGGESSDDLAEALTLAFDRQIRWLPGYGVIGNAMRRAIARRYGDELQELETLVAIARGLGATQALETQVVLRGDSLSLSAQVYDVADLTPRERAQSDGRLDSLNTVVSRIVVDAFATQATRERADLPRSSPNGLEAIRAWWQATEHFRRGSYALADERLRTVIELDPEFAPAHFQRMLAILFDTRPSQYSEVIHTALAAATARREDLDSLDQELLTAYTALLNDGDIDRAEATALALTERYHRQVEPHFLLGYIRFNFRALLGSTLGEARYSFQQAVRIDPEFAIALAHLAAIAVVDNNRDQAQEYIGRLRLVDSTSIWSEAAGMADSLLYRNIAAKGQVIGSFGRRRSAVLEIFAVGAGELDAPSTVRPIAEEALDTLYQRSSERQLALRMKLATRLSTGRFGSADSMLAAAARLAIPQDEQDRWAVLTAVTRTHQLATAAAQREAVARLGTLANDVEAQWLAARWLLEEDRAAAQRPIRAVARIAADPTVSSPLARSLALDLRAVQRLSAGDSLAADSLWADATRFYSVDRLIYGLTGSLWPIRLARAELAHERGDQDKALQIIDTFEQMAGFVDQIAWPAVLRLKIDVGRESGDPSIAPAAYAKLAELLADADGDGIALRDSIQSFRP